MPGPKKSPYFCMKLSKSGSLPSARSRSIWFSSRTISRMRARSSGDIFWIACCIPWKYDCITCCWSICSSSWNFSRASPSMKS